MKWLDGVMSLPLWIKLKVFLRSDGHYGRPEPVSGAYRAHETARLMVWESWAWAGSQEAPQSPPFPSLLQRKPEGEDPTQKTFVPDLRHFQFYHVLKSHT